MKKTNNKRPKYKRNKKFKYKIKNKFKNYLFKIKTYNKIRTIYHSKINKTKLIFRNMSKLYKETK